MKIRFVSAKSADRFMKAASNSKTLVQAVRLDKLTISVAPSSTNFARDYLANRRATAKIVD